MSFRSLLNSRVQIYRLSIFTQDGVATNQWLALASPFNYIPVRLDLSYLRPGKDVQPPIQQGRAPDRVGVMLYEPGAGFEASDIVVAIPNDYGQIPIPGAFQLRTIPDEIQAYSAQHHLEASILETSQAYMDSIRPFPGGE